MDFLMQYLLSSCQDFDDSDDDDENESDFFYPNACQICGCMGRLLRCSKCHMVSYCGKGHQTEHWQSHKTFCRPLAESRKTNDDPLKAAKGRKQEAWVAAKSALINLVTRKLRRKLTRYEQKVIRFTRACAVCHDTDHQRLISCPNCASVSFCQQHKDLYDKVHAEKCPELKLCYILDLEKLEKKRNHYSKKKAEAKKRAESNQKYEQKEKLNSEQKEKLDSEQKEKLDSEEKSESKESKEKKEVKEYLDPDTKIYVIREAPIKSVPYLDKCPDSMKNFMEIFSQRELNDNVSGNESFEISDLFIKPLSVYRALEKLDQVGKRDLVIHVIGAKEEDLDSYLFWESLLHLMPNLTSLKIVFFSQKFLRQNLNPKLCEKCMETDKILAFELCNLDYKIFMEEKTFSTPSLVIGFQIQLKQEADSLFSVANFKAPFAFTSNVEKIVKEDHKYMKKLFKKLMGYDVFEKNPFSGIKPHLDFETDGVLYEHHFLTIYTDLSKAAKENRKQK